jgi:hypothetical protein
MRDNTGRSGGCGSVGIYSPLLTEGFARPPSPGVPCLSVVAGTNTLGCGSKPTRPPFSRAKVWAAVPFQALSPEVKPNDGDDHERQQDENQDREAVHSIDSQFRQSLRVIYRVASPAKENPARIAPSGVVGVRGDLVQHAIEKSVARVRLAGRVHDREALAVQRQQIRCRLALIDQIGQGEGDALRVVRKAQVREGRRDRIADVHPACGGAGEPRRPAGRTRRTPSGKWEPPIIRPSFRATRGRHAPNSQPVSSLSEADAHQFLFLKREGRKATVPDGRPRFSGACTAMPRPEPDRGSFRSQRTTSRVG